jgi:small subunit ribosomal protein S18
MLQNYELYLIFNPELSSDQISEQQNQILGTLDTELKAQNVQTNVEGLKKMAYPISKYRTGFYTLITFDVDLEFSRNIKNVEKKLNLNESVIRYIVINQTEFLTQKSKEKRNEVEITNHRELNKGKNTTKKCISKYMGIRVIDYKDVDYLNQFTSPYAKIFAKAKTGSSSKFQRKINQAIKRARHMALMPFTPIHND